MAASYGASNPSFACDAFTVQKTQYNIQTLLVHLPPRIMPPSSHRLVKPKVVAITTSLPPQAYRNRPFTASLHHQLSALLSSTNHRPPLPTLLTVLALSLLLLSFLLDTAAFFHLTSNLTAPLTFVSTQATQVYRSLTMSSVKPPSKKELGNAGWTLIHSIAANYPQNPTDNEQRHAKNFLKAIGKLYPCKYCRRHFDKYISTNPPDLSSRDQFVLWACGAHNAVNRRSGKKEFPCRVSNLDARWVDCGCKNKQK